MGLVVSGKIGAKMVGIEGSILGLDIPAFFTDAIDDVTEADHYLFQLTQGDLSIGKADVVKPAYSRT